MKGIIFGEGKNDVFFTCEIFDRAGFTGYEYIRFHAEDHESNIIPKQSDDIRHFCTREGPRTLLIKSEQGNSQIISVVSSLLIDLTEYEEFFSLIIDLDNGTLQQLEDELSREIGKRWKEVDIDQESVDSYSDFYGIRYKVTAGSDFKDTFGVLAFYESLEDLVGIEDDPRKVCEQKISMYLNQNSGLANQAVNILI